MRKIVLTIISFILICFLIPILFTTRMRTEDVMNMDAEEKFESEEYIAITRNEYGEFNTIRLLRTASRRN
ncbi:MAG: hypothetical protein FWC79_04700 [Oscillospiraceae bacterium]|nr:hypothetical protein [Oscillospiraceae bacterium]